jgi:hypothetical protein
MTRWRERAEELLYNGESIEKTVETDGARVVVTSHRLLAFAPDTGGATFRQVDRPNVTGVDTGAQSETGLLEHTVTLGVTGVVLLVAGALLDFGAIVGDADLTGGQAAGQIGVGGVLEQLQTVLGILRNLDVYMQLLGALALLFAVLLSSICWYLRDSTLVIEVEADDDIHVSKPENAARAVARLERALFSSTPGETDSAPGETGTGPAES